MWSPPRLREDLVRRGDLGQAPHATRTEDGVRHPDQVEEVLEGAVPEFGPQRGRGGIVRPGDHRPQPGHLGAGQEPVLVQGLTQERAEDGHLDHAG